MERRDYILELLYENTDKWISGEEISNLLGISRTAVWKHINNLRESGYFIESSTKHGHKLLSTSNILNEFEIKKNLNTGFIGKRDVYFYPETDSTNIQAFKIASNGGPEGTIVIAESQTDGKGRLGRKWISPSKENIYISIILRPQIPTFTAPRLTLVTAVALSETLDSIGAPGHRIKWPNDILYNNRKLSGILTEMKGDCDGIDFIITGLGINLNSLSDSYPDEIKNSMISLKEITGTEIYRAEFLKIFLQNFETNYLYFLQGNFLDILEKWKIKSAIINQKIKVTNYDDFFTGIVSDVTPDGNLIVQTDNGIRQVNSGDINYLKDF